MAQGIPDYDELKLRIEPGGETSYRVLAFGPDGSTAQAIFAIPFQDYELDNFVLRVGQPRRSVRAFRASEMEEAKRLGSKLFESLFQGDVREIYRAARSVADSKDRGLRVTLYLTGVPKLMEIPWEFMYERPSFLSQSVYTPLVRSLDLRRTRPPRKVTLPLQILGMVSGPEGLPPLDADEEREKLENALKEPAAKGLVRLRWLNRGTLSELERTVGAPGDLHILHYIGHGAYDERGKTGILVLEDERGGPHEVTGEELGSVLIDERSLQLVVLNSCEGVRNSHVDPFSGAATSLIEVGIPAVVGMQFEITDGAAITFADRLYTALGQGFSVDAAIGHARKALFAAGHDVEFGTPVLFLCRADARLFDIAPEDQEERERKAQEERERKAREERERRAREERERRAREERERRAREERERKAREERERKKRLRLIAGALVLVIAVAGGIVLVSWLTPEPPSFVDNFTSDEYGWDYLGATGTGGHYNGTYRISAQRGEEGCCVIASPGTASAADLRIEVDGRPIDETPSAGFGYGVFCRANESEMDFYTFTIWANDVAIGKVTDAKYQHLTHDETGIRAAGQKDVMKLGAVCSTVEVEGKRAVRLIFMVNDERILTYEDSNNPYENGTFGLYTVLPAGGGVSGDRLTVEFDNFAEWGVSIRS
jgi:CHAT domain-containing protein